MHKVLADEIASYSMEKRYLHADGDAVWVNLSVSLVRDDGGAPLYFVSQIEDVTERKRVEEAWLRESATVGLLERVAVAANEAESAGGCVRRDTRKRSVRIRVGRSAMSTSSRPTDVTELVPSGIWHFDDDSGFETLRTAIEATPLGRGVGLAGRVDRDGRRRVDCRPHGRRRGTSETRNRLRRQGGFRVSCTRRARRSWRCWSSSRSTPPSPMIELLGVMTNLGTQLGRVVERERLRDQQEELDSARERFVANAAHELRTPLATMRAVAGLLGTRRDDMTREEVEECFEMLERQGEGLEVLVRDLLDLSLIEHGEADLDAHVRPGRALDHPGDRGRAAA